MNRLLGRCRDFPLRTALAVAGGSAAAAAAVLIVACGMGFQPGWADWPGASKHAVFATFACGALFAALLSAGAATVAVPCAALQRLVGRDFVGWGAFASLMATWAVAAAALAARAYPVAREAIERDWP